MERAQILVIAVVVAALALFGLRFFSHDDVESTLEASPGRVGELASVRDEIGDASGGAPGTASGRAQSARLRPLAGRSSNEPGGRTGGVSGGAGDRRGGGSALITGGGVRGSGGVPGASGSGRGERGSGGSGVALTNEAGGRLAPRAQLKDDLVESLSERPPTMGDAAKPVDDADVALKVDKPDDIAPQAGQGEDVKKPDDGGDGLKITDRGRIEFPNAGNAGEAGTISFQVKPDWSGADQTDNALVQIRGEHQWNNRLELVKNGEFLRFIVTDDTGKETDISTRISNWQPGEQHDVRASWGEGTTTLYIDGQVAGQNSYPGTVHFSDGTPMFLGGDYRSSNYAGANATLYDFTLNNSAIHP